MWRACALVACSLAAGCSLLFDGNALLVDGAAPPDQAVVIDLAAAPADMAAPPDLSVACTPALFAGLGDLGAVDCPCGCVIDPFTTQIAATGDPRWTGGGSTGWSYTSTGGSLTLSKMYASNGDAYAFTGKFLLEGDFDVTVDFAVIGPPQAGRAMFVSYGPFDADLGIYSPTLFANDYMSAQGTRAQDYAAQSYHDVANAPTSGTMHLSRSGGQSCAETVGVDSICAAAPSPRMYLYLWAGAVNGNCFACGTAEVRFSNLVLNRGRLVAP